MTDLRKYGAQMPNDRLAAASTQGSLSCRAALGLILTKTIYMLKDTEKIGLYTQLICEAYDTLLAVYRVEGNHEFTELIHLCLIAFDSVSHSILWSKLIHRYFVYRCASFIETRSSKRF